MKSSDSIKRPSKHEMDAVLLPRRNSGGEEETCFTSTSSIRTPLLLPRRADTDDYDCNCQELFTISLFCFMNFLNFVNRYTTPPIVSRLKTAFHIDDASIGMVQSGFEICYVLTAPLFGYLGDRVHRKHIMAFSLLLSTISALLSSFVPETWFWSLLVTRSLLGIAEAGYTNICPSIIGDLFVGKKRTIVLTAYQIAIPIGCGVGYIGAGSVANWSDNWRWAFRLTPLPMFLSAICLLIFINEPERGQAEHTVGQYEQTSYLEDMNYLVSIPSYLMTSIAFVGSSFAVCALCYWTPDLVLRMVPLGSNLEIAKYSEAEVGTIFGSITILAGVIGVGSASVISSFLKPRYKRAADGIVSGATMILAAPTIFTALVTMETNLTVSWLFTSVGIALLTANLVLTNEITLNVVIATRRATAESFQTTISHLFGDATAPFLCGMISDALRNNHYMPSVISREDFINYKALQYSLFVTLFLTVISAGFFLFASLHIDDDAKRTKDPVVNHSTTTTIIATSNNGNYENCFYLNQK